LINLNDLKKLDRLKARPLPHPNENTSGPLVAILMGTKDGGEFIDEQLESIADQTHKNWILIASDDGSLDDSILKLQRFAETHFQRTIIRTGPHKGVCANFLSLANDPTIDADYFAFSDQDDIWHRDKLRHALIWLVTVPVDTPAMYCGRTELMTSDERSYGLSPLFTRSAAFENALVQSLGGGNTIVFNGAAKKLLEQAGETDVVLHDWWLYQLVSGVGGAVHYDPRPMVKYRQHPDNLIGSNLGWRNRLIRFQMMLSGRFRDWNEKNIAALQRVSALLQPKNRQVLTLFINARRAALPKCLYFLRKSGVYRQTLLGNFGLFVATILKRI
jgi:glycosyltransferase involved in cell wall biosynthesis